jgi:AcrR family transcriptional regulator
VSAARTSHTETGRPRPRVSRGTLSREHIVDATLRLVREEPDGPITMERVASVLGTRPMSLYTHVRNRDELVALAAQQALREWDASVPKGARWDNQLRSWCRSLREHVQAYPPLMLEMTGHGTFQPALLEAVAVLARILRKAGLEGEALAAALRWVPQTVLGAIILELSRPEGLETPDHEAAAIYGSLASLEPTDRAQYDDVLPYFASPELADLFDYSIDRLVDGVRAVAVRT